MLSALAGSATSFCAEKILFIGNSYTFAALAPGAGKLGGVPKLFEAIAASKGKSTEVGMIAAGGKDLEYHLHQNATETVLKAKQWDFVVLQDHSMKTTHLGNLRESLATGEIFYKKIRSYSPHAKIVLYETWARGKGNCFYTGTSSKSSFVDADQMMAEIEKGYAQLDDHLEAIDPGEQSRLAPVGEAFALCQKRYPAIDLYSCDHHHASEQGYYLSALVIYATIFHDSPLGACYQFPGLRFDPSTAEKLQRIAAEEVKAKGEL